MTQKRIVSLSVVAALGLLSPLTSWAFGLGQITVNSALNQPFSAEIPVTSLRATERGNLDVRLASLSDFDRAGLDRSLLLTQLRFEVIEQGDKALVKITSQVPIKEPFLDFLVTASAGEGRMLREYTVLLDPPADIYQRPSQPATTASPAPTTSSPAARTPSRPAYSSDQYQVRRGDTLWQIAQQTKPAADITAQQMMMALLAVNPQAFQNNNINGLKADVTLQIPDAATIRQLSSTQANMAVQDQAAQWKNRNQQVTAAPAPAVTETVTEPPEPAETPAQTSTDEAASETAEPEATDVAEPTADESSRLKLVAAADDGEAGADPSLLGDPEVERLNEQLTLAQETIEAQTQENIDFKERMDAMESQMETMRRLLSLKDEDMARLQAMLENDADTAEASQAIAGLDTQGPATPATTDNTAQSVDDNPVASNEPASQDADKPAAANYLSTAKAYVSNYLMEVLLGGLLLLLLIWLIVRHRRQEQTWDEAVADIDDEQNVQADIDDAAENLMVAPEVTELESVAAAPEKTADELVEQADMFVGYADYVQARTALEQARQIAPEDKAIAAKLLFVLFKQNKADDFDKVLTDSNIDLDDTQWPDVRGWGLALMPGDGRFQNQPAAVEKANEPATASEETVTDTTEAPQTTTETESADEAASAIDFDLSQYQTDDAGTTPAPADDMTETDTGDARASQFDETPEADDLAPIRLDIDDSDSGDIEWQPEQQSAPLDEDLQPISLDLDDDENADPQTVSDAEKQAMQELDSGDMQDDLDFDLSGFDEVDEAETKLDLAAAYVDMGDPEGARGILQEVLSEGSEEQKQRAQTLLDSLT